MGIFFIYTIKAALCLTAFYLLYKVTLSRETFHSFNRAVLLGVMALSLILPVVHVPSTFAHIAGGGVAQIGALIGERFVEEAAKPDLLTPARMLLVIYIIGVVFFIARELRSLMGLFAIMRAGRRVHLEDDIRLIVVKEDISPFSWFGNVIISEKDYEENPDEILTHEKAHIARHHSLDVLLCNLFIILQWFNPAAWLVKAELQNIHEYEADAAVLSCGIDPSGYQLLLIRKAVGDRLYSMANNLNHSSLKKRIKMMLNKKSNPRNRAKALFVVPVAVAAVAVFASPTVENVTGKMKAEGDGLVAEVVNKVSSMPVNTATVATAAATEPAAKPFGSRKDSLVKTTAAQVEGSAKPADKPVDFKQYDENVYNTVEDLPSFPGGMPELFKFMQQNIKYPAEAIASKKAGSVIVSFVVSKDGSITDVGLIRGISPELDAEALRVVRMMPKWNPGKVKGEPVNVKFTLPVNFSLSGSTTGNSKK